MSSEITDRLTRPTLARITGGLYLAYMVASVLADAQGNIGLGNAQQILDSMTGSPQSFRLGLVFAFLSAFLFLMAAWGLFVLLRPMSTVCPRSNRRPWRWPPPRCTELASSWPSCSSARGCSRSAIWS